MSGIQIKYLELIKLSVEQLFYKNKICRQYTVEPELDIQIVPTESCLDIIRRMDLVFRNTNTNGGFIVLARASGTNAAGDNLLRFPAKKEDVLSFFMILKNTDVLNFDELPSQPSSGRVYYFSNEIIDAAVPRNNLHLTKDASGVNGINDSVKISSENYRYHSAVVVTAGSAKVKHLSTGEAIDPKSLNTHGGQSDLAFDLSAFPTGKYQLLINNLPVDEFYYSGKTFGHVIFGIIELSLSQTLASNYRIIEPDRSLTAERPLYVIQFINRQTLWRYTIHLQTSSPLYIEMEDLTPAQKVDFLNRLNIISNDATITFNKITATDTEFIFVSDSAVPLREKYFSSTSMTNDILNLTLKKYVGDVAKEAAVKANLSYPSTNSIDASAFPQIYSDIFLTI